MFCSVGLVPPSVFDGSVTVQARGSLEDTSSPFRTCAVHKWQAGHKLAVPRMINCIPNRVQRSREQSLESFDFIQGKKSIIDILRILLPEF